MYPGEEVEHKTIGNYVDLRIRMKRTLWIDLTRRAAEQKKDVDTFIFQNLVALASEGKKESLDYIT